jgi:diketogulonate reductase-like aldo/keto reductase
MPIPTITLSNGSKIPQVGLGTWQMREQTECQQAVTWALEAGYRHIDTAQVYKNEEFVGAAVAKSGLKRSELFITTKIWNENQWWDDVEPSLDESLAKLQTEYVDLLLLHWPITETRGPAWRKLEEMLQKGKTKAIGVSNYTIRHLKELLAQTKIKPVVNQVELHVFLQQPELVEFCKQQNIIIEAYSPLAHGTRLDDPVLAAIAKKHTKTTSQIMLRWCVQSGFVVIPKSTHQERLAQNIDIFNFELDAGDMAKIKKLESNFRTCGDPTNMP